jgi:hypothetical protein
MAGMDICTTCHSNETSEWLSSGHANLGPTNELTSYGVPTLGQVQASGTCATCHDPTGDSGNLTEGYTGIARPVVGCEACHGAGSLHVAQSGIGPISLLSNTASRVIGTVPVSGQFAMCTACHELLDSSGTGTDVAEHDPLTSGATTSGSQYVITDTHLALPNTYSAYGANTSGVTGYAMDFANSKVCTQCHNPHGAADVHKEWAASGHADKDATAPWAYYNWSCDYDANCGSYGAAAGDRTTCQRCHTTTGFAAYADALQQGDTAGAEAIWTGASPRIAYDANFKPEMLLCTGCHTDNEGTLRNPGAYTASYKIPVGGFPSTSTITADVSFQYPDIGASNVCMPCHTARGSGRAISDVSTAQSFTNFSYPDGHYLSAGGTMFKGTAYEYGRSYVDPSSFKHKLIGTPDAEGTGDEGPCIGCHMDRTGVAANHLFQPIGRNASGNIVNVSSEVCFECHAGSASSLAEVLEAERENYEYALAALENQLLVSDPSYSFTASYPYFTNSNHLSTGDTDATGNNTGKNNLGAAFNLSLLHHDPGGYIHNSRYVKRIIYDSIDWLDNHQMDYSVGATLDASALVDPGKTEAMNYLLSQVSYDSGGAIIPSPAERP